MKEREGGGWTLLLTRLLEVGALCGLAWAFVWAFQIPYCGALFQCGCTFPWAGGATNCNIHDYHTPNCPWCMALGWKGDTVYPIVFWAVMVGAYLTASLVVLIRKRPAPSDATPLLPEHSCRAKAKTSCSRISISTLVAVAAFLLYGFISALAFAKETGYPRGVGAW